MPVYLDYAFRHIATGAEARGAMAQPRSPARVSFGRDVFFIPALCAILQVTNIDQAPTLDPTGLFQFSKMLSVNAPSCTFDFSTMKPSPLSFIVSTAKDNFPDHIKYFSRPMRPPRGVLPTPQRSSKAAAHERTRQTFFTKVRQAGDERTWQSRSDLVKRIIHSCEGTLY